MKRNRWVKFILVAGILAGVLYPQAARAQFYYMENSDIGKPVKDFTLKIANGESTSLDKYRDGKKAIVFFWATWCPHCRHQLDRLNKEKASIIDRGIKIAPVDVGESEAIVNKYLKSNKVDMNVFLDVDSKVSNDYNLIGVPTFYFVGADGNVVSVGHALPEDIDAVFTQTK